MYGRPQTSTKLTVFRVFQYSNIYPTRFNVTQFVYVWKLLYTFRVVPPPIIRSSYNCIYSIWYLSHRYCYLPLSWKSWNWFQCAVGGVFYSRNLKVTSFRGFFQFLHAKYGVIPLKTPRPLLSTSFLYCYSLTL